MAICASQQRFAIAENKCGKSCLIQRVFEAAQTGVLVNVTTLKLSHSLATNHTQTSQHHLGLIFYRP
jgi:hypothetical protein